LCRRREGGDEVDPAERVARMEKTFCDQLGRALDGVEAKWVRALLVAVVVDSEVSRSEVETPS